MFEAAPTAFFDRQEAMEVRRRFFQGVGIVSAVIVVVLHLLLILGVDPCWFVFSPYLVLEEHNIFSSFCSLFVMSDQIDLICIVEILFMMHSLLSIDGSPSAGSLLALIGTALSGFMVPVPFLGRRLFWCCVGCDDELPILGAGLISHLYLLYLFLKKDSEAWIYFVLWLWMHLPHAK